MCTRKHSSFTADDNHSHTSICTCVCYLGVSRGDPLVGAVVLVVGVSGVGTDAVGVVGDDEREDLLARPERFRFQDGGLGDLPVPGGDPHQQLH